MTKKYMRSVSHITNGVIHKRYINKHTINKENTSKKKNSYKETIYFIIDQVLDVLMGI